MPTRRSAGPRAISTRSSSRPRGHGPRLFGDAAAAGGARARLMGWLARATGLPPLDPATRCGARPARAETVPAGTILFRPGACRGSSWWSGRIEVYLTGLSGREILLYAVEPGQTCVQSTLGRRLFGRGDHPRAERAGDPARDLPAADGRLAHAGLRRLCPGMQSMMHLLDRVAFQRIETRWRNAFSRGRAARRPMPRSR